MLAVSACGRPRSKSLPSAYRVPLRHRLVDRVGQRRVRASCSRRDRRAPTDSVAIMPPAPVLFSITTCVPRISPILAPTTRAMMSDGPPGANPTTILIGLFGKAPCASATPGMTAATPKIAATTMARPRLQSCSCRILPVLVGRSLQAAAPSQASGLPWSLAHLTCAAARKREASWRTRNGSASSAPAGWAWRSPSISSSTATRSSRRTSTRRRWTPRAPPARRPSRRRPRSARPRASSSSRSATTTRPPR